MQQAEPLSSKCTQRCICGADLDKQSMTVVLQYTLYAESDDTLRCTIYSGIYPEQGHSK